MLDRGGLACPSCLYTGCRESMAMVNILSRRGIPEFLGARFPGCIFDMSSVRSLSKVSRPLGSDQVATKNKANTRRSRSHLVVVAHDHPACSRDEFAGVI